MWKRRSSAPNQDTCGARPVFSRLSAALLLWLVCFLGASSGHCQTYTFEQFGPNQGLLNLDVSAIVQDTQGVLWVGTENGVFRADSTHFVKVPSYRDAEEGSVRAMTVDGAGRVWVAGSRRLVYLTRDGARHDVSELEPGGILDDTVRLAALPSQPNRLYLLLNGRLEQIDDEGGGSAWSRGASLDRQALELNPQLGKLSGLIADPARNALWSSCGDALCQIRLPAADAISQKLSVSSWDGARGVPSGPYTSLLLARDGGLWAASARGLLHLDAKNWLVKQYANPPGGGSIQKLAEDKEGGLVATLPGGLARLEGESWTRWTVGNGLPPGDIAALLFDCRGGFWLAPNGGGIWRWLGYGNWQHWTRTEGIEGDLAWSILRDRTGRLWATGSSDVYRFDQGRARFVPQVPGKPVAALSSLVVDSRGHVWTTSAGGELHDFDPATNRRREIATGADRIYRLYFEAGSERLWACSKKGVGWLSAREDWSVLHLAESPEAPKNNIWGVTEDPSGAMWFTGRGTLYRYKDSAWARIGLPPEAKIVGYASIQAARDGSLWMQAANPHPLLQLVVTGKQARTAGSVSEDLIGSDDISIIYFDHRGWLWVGTDIGLYVFDGRRWVHCTQEDGMISDDTVTAGIFEDADGSMWFGTVGGLSHLLHPEDLFKVPAPQMSIRDVRLNGIQLRPDTRPRLDLRAPELAADLFSTDYKRPRAVVFRYRLRGLDEDWHISDSGALRFPGLPARDYVLQVQAVDTRVHAASALVEYQFEVLPPWYQRDRAKLGALMLTLAIAASWWRASLLRLRTSESVLKRKVDEQTAELRAEKEQLQLAQRELVESSRRDFLTGLLNRSAIFDILTRMRRRSLESGAPLCVVMADLDHFKSINDRFGHTMGDAVLRECAVRFQETLRPDDFVGRYGGEEVLLVIPGLYRDQAAARLEEIREAIASRPVVYGACSITVTTSLGAAWLSEHNREIESVVNDADAALYMAKQNGRNRIEFAPELDDEAYVQSHLFELGSAPDTSVAREPEPQEQAMSLQTRFEP